VQIIRNLSLQENITHKLLNDFGIKTPRFGVAKNDKDAEEVARDLLAKNYMVKAQILAGDRATGKFSNGFEGGVHSAIS
jgi:succinyl-CoA synthetase beta subunit